MRERARSGRSGCPDRPRSLLSIAPGGANRFGSAYRLRWPTGTLLVDRLPFAPGVHLALGLVTLAAVTFLNLPDQLVLRTIEDVPVVVGGLPHSTFALPLNCFQLPSMRSQFMFVTSVSGRDQ